MAIEIVIAGIVTYIAWQQYNVERNKLRLALYNKRYEVFHALMTLLGHILQQGSVKLEQIDECSRATKEAVFLFEEDIETYLKTIRQKAGDLWAAEETMNPLPRGKERSAQAAEVSKLCGWFSEQSKVAIDKFGKYLKFEQIGRSTRLWCLLSSAFHYFRSFAEKLWAKITTEIKKDQKE